MALDTWEAIHVCADVCAILTFVIAAIAACWGAKEYWDLNHRKMQAFERHLREKKEAALQQSPHGQIRFTALHIASHVKITPDEAVKLGFKNPRIGVLVKKNTQGYAEALLFEYLLPGERGQVVRAKVDYVDPD